MTPALVAEHEFVVLAYRDSPFLPACLRSLRDQSLASRIIISTSTPSTYVASVAAEFGLAVRVNPHRVGIGADWNFALHQSSRRYVTLAHQDDVYEADFLAQTLGLFDRHSEGAICFTGYQEIGDDGAPKSSKISWVKHLMDRAVLGRRPVVRGQRLQAYLSFGNPLPCSSATFDRIALGDFEFCEAFDSNLDWDAWLRLCRDGFVFLHAPERLVGRRHNALTETSRLILEGRREREDQEMFKRIWPRPLAQAIALAYRAGY